MVDTNIAEVLNTPAEVDLGRRVAELRAEFGWSQSELARRSGVSRATVARIESGEVDLLRSARALAGALGLPIAELLAAELELGPTEVDRLTLAADLRDLAARAGRLVVVPTR